MAPLRNKFKDYLFRSLVLSTLLWVGVGFGVYQGDDTHSKQQEEHATEGPKNIETQKSFWGKTTEDPTAFFTMALAFLTAVLAGNAMIQIYYLRRTDLTASKTASAALKSALAAERALEGADAPFVSVILTLNAHRHHILGGNDVIQFRSSERLIFYRFTNYGKSPAFILEVYKGVLVSETLPKPTVFPPPQSNLFKVEIVGPDKETLNYSISRTEVLSAGGGANDEWENPLGQRKLWIVFQIRYCDALGAQFISGHTFAFNAYAKEFYAQGGTRYNYRRKLTDDERAAMELRDAL